MFQFHIGLMYQHKSKHYSTIWLKNKISEARHESEDELKKEFPNCNIKIKDINAEIGKKPQVTTIKDIVSCLVTELDLVIFEFSDNNPNVLIEFGIRLNSKKPFLIIKNKKAKTELPSNVRNELYITYSEQDGFFSSDLAQKIVAFARFSLPSSNHIHDKDCRQRKLTENISSGFEKTWPHHDKLFEISIDYEDTLNINKEFANDLRQLKLTEKFKYIGLEEALSWIRLCNDPEYRTYRDSLDLIRKEISKMLDEVYANGVSNIDFVCLGAGGGMKETVIVRRILERQKDLYFYLVDASIEMLCMSLIFFVNHLKGFEGRISGKGILCDIRTYLSSIPKLSFELRTGLYSLLGNSIGNYPETSLLKSTRHMMEYDDYILIDAQLLPEDQNEKMVKEKFVNSYDNPYFKEFAMTPLLKAGITKSDGVVKVEMVRHHPRLPDRAYTIQYYFKFTNEINTKYGVSFRKGDSIQLGYSIKYDLGVLKDIISKAGFKIINSYVSADKYYGVVLAQKSEQ